MATAKPRRHERGLVMPPGGRRIPRAPAPSRKPRSTPSDGVAPPPDVAKAGGDLVALAARIRTCTRCERASDERAYGTGHPRAPVMLVGERPTLSDLEAGGAFTDGSEALDKAFEALGIPLSWVYGATAVRCGSDAATIEQIAACSIHLLVEVEALEPQVIVAFGAGAVQALRSLDGRCGIRVPQAVPQGEPTRLRPGLCVIATEPLPAGVTQKESKRRLWKDLQKVPELLAASALGD